MQVGQRLGQSAAASHARYPLSETQAIVGRQVAMPISPVTFKQHDTALPPGQSLGRLQF